MTFVHGSKVILVIATVILFSMSIYVGHKLGAKKAELTKNIKEFEAVSIVIEENNKEVLKGKEI